MASWGLAAGVDAVLITAALKIASQHGLPAVVSSPELWGAVGMAVTAQIGAQQAFARGALNWSLPALTVCDPLAAVPAARFLPTPAVQSGCSARRRRATVPATVVRPQGGETHERRTAMGAPRRFTTARLSWSPSGAPPGNSREATPMDTNPFATRHFRSTTASDRDQAQADGTGPPRATGERALVLGGGGSAGNAWVIGVVAGLFAAGLDVTDADLIIGTSAGSTAAAQLTSVSPPELLAAILESAPPQRTGAAGSDREAAPVRRAMNHMERTSRIIAAAENAADMRRRLGASALELDAASYGSEQTRWRATVAARLPGQRWPDRPMLITAVDARTGEPVVFDRRSGVDLVDAVAASCSSGPPYAIGDSRFIDGGYRRGSENADLAAGYGRVLVLSPFGGRSRHPREWGTHLAAQVDELRARGSRVETILPDSNAREAFGSTMMDLSRRPPAARAGYDQGRGLAGPLAEFWR